ncbi:hypothetical protein CRX72_04125 [Pantoea sp. BRM17]|nr:hypothetical protein CRX72_04125 [Pantoea sp. BRM17]
MANDNFLKTMGYREQEILGRHHSQFCPPETQQSNAYRRFWQKLNQGEYISGQFQRGEGFSDKFLRVAKHSRPVWLEANYVPVQDRSGRVIKIVKLASDITAHILDTQEQRAMTAAIDRSMATLSSLQDAIAMIEFTPDGKIITANDLFLERMGYTLPEIVGQHHALFCTPDMVHSAAYRDFWQRLNR